ncbi:MAG TPA: protein translocase SEC61 complex subunit gamma [Nanoarchaeota archaeon]|nr:protein translocase SEC61 complex subunit gamma [Nanoarchaeota archaeon]
MDFNQGRTETPDKNEDEEQASQDAEALPEEVKEEKPAESKPKMAMPRFSLPKIEIKSDITQKIVNTLKEYKRVIQITKKPDIEEFKTTVKASALGIAIIGAVGFIIAIIAQLLTGK